MGNAARLAPSQCPRRNTSPVPSAAGFLAGSPSLAKILTPYDCGQCPDPPRCRCQLPKKILPAQFSSTRSLKERSPNASLFSDAERSTTSRTGVYAGFRVLGCFWRLKIALHRQLSCFSKLASELPQMFSCTTSHAVGNQPHTHRHGDPVQRVTGLVAHSYDSQPAY